MIKKSSYLLFYILLSSQFLLAQERPNIVFLFSDDQTINTLGSYGNKEILTPNLDRLSSMGVRFTNHYNTTAICMASRACVLTGLYEYKHGANFGHGDLERRFFDNSYTAQLRKAGYYTGIVGKIGVDIQDEGFDIYEEEFDDFAAGPNQTFYKTSANKKLVKYANKYPHATRANGAWAIDFMKDAKKTGKPFCMSVSFKAPHRPTTPDPIDVALYKEKTFTKPYNYGNKNGEHLSEQSHTSRAAKAYRYWLTDYDQSVRDYYALISGVDTAVGMIMEGLKKEGLDKNTIIIFTSDNGYNCGAHGFTGKVLPYEESSKSPLIIYDPRLPKEHQGKVSDALTANVDMAATIFSFSGVPNSKDIDGENLRPLLEKPNSNVRKWLPLFNFWGTAAAQSMAVVTKDWKYVYWYSGEKGMKPTEELFDLRDNRFEMKNVANKYKEELNRMKKHYKQELNMMNSSVVSGHDYESFFTLFNPEIEWETKKHLVKEYSGRTVKPKKSKKKNPIRSGL